MNNFILGSTDPLGGQVYRTFFFSGSWGRETSSSVGWAGPCVHAPVTSAVSNSVTPWSAARQAPLSMGFSRQEYWSGLPCPPPGDLPDPGIEPRSPAAVALLCPADSFLLRQRGSPVSFFF